MEKKNFLGEQRYATRLWLSGALQNPAELTGEPTPLIPATHAPVLKLDGLARQQVERERAIIARKGWIDFDRQIREQSIESMLRLRQS